MILASHEDTLKLGRTIGNVLKAGDILVVRGLGKFIYEGNGNETRKGRVYVRLKKYV